MGNYLDIIGHRTSIQLKIRKKKTTAPKQQTTLPSTPWLVGAFISSTKKQLPFVASCTHQKNHQGGLARGSFHCHGGAWVWGDRGLVLRTSRLKWGRIMRHPPTPRWDQDECEKRIKQNSLTSTWFNMIEVLFTKTSSQVEFASNFVQNYYHGYYKSSCFPSCCHLRSPDY